jgi:hypothetical protein
VVHGWKDHAVSEGGSVRDFFAVSRSNRKVSADRRIEQKKHPKPLENRHFPQFRVCDTADVAAAGACVPPLHVHKKQHDLLSPQYDRELWGIERNNRYSG